MLITAADKRQNRGASRHREPKTPVACLVKGSDALTHLTCAYASDVIMSVWPENTPPCCSKPGEKATYDAATQRIVFSGDAAKGPRPPGNATVTFAPAPVSYGARPVVKADVARSAESHGSSSLSSPTPLCLTIHVDSGTGQILCSCPDAFLSLRPCAIEAVGVSGSLPVFGVGTAVFAVRTITARTVVVLLHNCLLFQGSPFNLLSVSQFQLSAQNTVDFSIDSPSLTVTSSHGCVGIPLLLDDGL